MPSFDGRHPMSDSDQKVTRMLNDPLARHLAETIGIDLDTVEKILDAISATLRDNAMRSRGESFEVEGLGEFSFRAYEALGTAFNLKTGQPLAGPHMRLMYFRTLDFQPCRRLYRGLKNNGYELSFKPVDELNCREIIGTLMSNGEIREI